MAKLLSPPTYFLDSKSSPNAKRAVSWLELFYDLVFVATLIQLGDFLGSELHLQGIGQFLVMLTAIWWVWFSMAFFQNRYVVDDLPHRILIFFQISAIAIMGISLRGAFGELATQFTIACVATRLALILMYARTMFSHPESRQFTARYVAGFSLASLVWTSSIFLPEGYQWIAWLVGIGIELSVPQLSRISQYRRLWPVDKHHIAERFGIFIIIVIGESFIKFLGVTEGYSIGLPQISYGGVGLIVVFAVWWLYFDDLPQTEVNAGDDGRAILWAYGHLPLVVSLVAIGVSAKKLFLADIDAHSSALPEEYRVLYVSSLILYFIALTIIEQGLRFGSGEVGRVPRIVGNLVSAALIGIIGFALGDLAGANLVRLLALVVLGRLCFSIYLGSRGKSVAEAP